MGRSDVRERQIMLRKIWNNVYLNYDTLPVEHNIKCTPSNYYQLSGCEFIHVAFNIHKVFVYII